MRSFIRVLSGGVIGAALLTGFALTSPAPAMAAAGFCDETENYICCCSQDASGQVINCKCGPKPPEEEKPAS